MSPGASPRPLAAFALRLLMATVLLGALAVRHGADLVQAILPLLRAELAALDDNYRIHDLRLQQMGADRVVYVEVSQARTIMLGEQVFVADPRGRANASTLVAHLTLPLVLLGACALAWPLSSAGTRLTGGQRISRILGRLLAMSLGGAAVLALDVPFVLWAEIWSLHVDAAQPDRVSALLMWHDFLQGGGRMALGVALGCLAGWLSGGRLDQPKARR